MNAIICIDNQNGIAFNHRRQSRDKVLIGDMLSFVREKPLYVSSYSAMLFGEEDQKSIRLSDAPHVECPQGAWCFLELVDPQEIEHQIETLIVYRWNKIYPGDLFLTIELGAQSLWKLQETKDFPGSSHEQLTREVYIKESNR